MSADEYAEWLLKQETDKCLLWPFAHNDRGYPQGRVGGKFRRVGRYICERAHGKPPTPDHEAAHSCKSRGCLNKRHLSWKTHLANIQDKDEYSFKGMRRGEDVWNYGGYKLTKRQKYDIRRSKRPSRELGRKYGVSKTTIQNVRNDGTQPATVR